MFPGCGPSEWAGAGVSDEGVGTVLRLLGAVLSSRAWGATLKDISPPFVTHSPRLTGNVRPGGFKGPLSWHPDVCGPVKPWVGAPKHKSLPACLGSSGPGGGAAVGSLLTWQGRGCQLGRCLAQRCNLPPLHIGAVLPAGVGAGPPAACAILRVPAEETCRGALGAPALLRAAGELALPLVWWVLGESPSGAGLWCSG